MFNHMLAFIKKEIVFCVAAVFAAISCIFVHPSTKYFGYIDFRVLSLLLGLMLVVAAFRSFGLMDRIVDGLLNKVHTTRTLELILVLICFFSGMIITNDVALITFVPLAIILLRRTDPGRMIYIIVLQTVSANLGSMVTPIGNPQNLYLYTSFDMNITTFFKTLLPLAGIALIMLILAVVLLPSKAIETQKSSKQIKLPAAWKMIVLAVLFIMCLLCVARILDYRIMLGIVILGIVIIDMKLMLKADYMLLLTFMAFFIFVGNMRQLPQIRDFLSHIISGNEILVSIITSQVISNVPAAVLLSGFTDDARALLIGTDVGGLGTIIASMASLISFKIYCTEENTRKGRYLLVFTAVNVVFLAVLCLCTIFII